MTDDELGVLAGREPAKSATRGGGGMSDVELLDELEAGELSVEFEGEEPRGGARVGARALRAADRHLHGLPGSTASP